MKTLKQLKKEAAKRGIVPGAVIKSAWPGGSLRTGVVPDKSSWQWIGDVNLFFESKDGDVWIYEGNSNKWASVITPAPSKEEGLVHGDAVECGPAMRAAIVELAKELGVEMHQPGINDIQSWPFLSWANGLLGGCNNANRVGYNSPNTPEAFMAKMRITAALPKPEPPINIESDGKDYQVQFRAGDVKIGCTVIDNATVRLIASKLID